MAIKLLDDIMICHEMSRLAYRLGLQSDFSEKDCHCSTDFLRNKLFIQYKNKGIALQDGNIRTLSLDDFASKYILPLLQECMSHELRFIMMDCS